MTVVRSALLRAFGIVRRILGFVGDVLGWILDLSGPRRPW